MRSTRATAAVARLNARCPDQHYMMAKTAAEHFLLLRHVDDGEPEPVGEALDLDDFVVFVNRTGPQTAPKVSKFDRAFEAQLASRRTKRSGSPD